MNFEKLPAVLHYWLKIYAFIPALPIGIRAIFRQGGGKLFAQKILASCPNFYETVEQKWGSYDATTRAYIWSESILANETVIKNMSS